MPLMLMVAVVSILCSIGSCIYFTLALLNFFSACFYCHLVSALDHCEIRDFFRGMGMALSETVLDELMKRFDSDSDGTVSFDEFKSMMHELQNLAEKKNNGFFLGGLGGKMKKALTKDGVTRTLDVAFQMSDIDNIENMGVSRSKEMQKIVSSELAPLTLVVYLKDVRVPLVVTCAKPGHAEAWEEAFCKCMESQGADDTLTDGCCNVEEWNSSTIDWA